MRIFLIITLLLVPFKFGFSQNKDYVQSIITELAGNEYKGRAYEKNYDKKVANFLKAELKKSKIKSVKGGYFQFFPITANSVSGKLIFEVNDSLLVPGKDYLVSLDAPTARGKYECFRVQFKDFNTKDSAAFVLENGAGKVLVFDSLPKTAFEKELVHVLLGEKTVFEGIVFLTDKLPPAVPKANVAEIPSFYLLRKLFPNSNNTIELFIESKLLKTRTQNVIAYIPGKSDSVIVLTAHYDHVGMMGNKTYFPGAHDNASGTAMVLDMASYFKSKKEKPKYSVLIIFFAGEELGLLGSLNYVENPTIPLAEIKFLLNLDMISGGELGIKVVNGTVFEKEFKLLTDINNSKTYLKEVYSRAPAANSDHHYFYEKGVRSFFIYTLGAYSEYHSITDKSDGLPLTEYTNLFKLLTQFIESL